MKPLTGEDDGYLVELARKRGSHDMRAFEELVRRHRGFVTANCRAITRSATDAEDLAQEVFVKAFFGLRYFEGRSQFRTWLQRIKVNHCLSYLRKTQGAVLVDIDDAGLASHRAMLTDSDPYAELRSTEDRQRIVRVLDSMSGTLRIPLMLRDADGLSYDEIAAHLGLSLSAVKMRIKRAREEFRLRFAEVSPGGRTFSGTAGVAQ
ncbi:MAG: RNA polymerase sigma factor [Vicinamibacterales bacterium]